ncbi:MAG: hypothetical protein LBC77_03290 [Spirochaetaceae bacterium]|jgi:hypothetical protein|nr:hypothetical protein [Spirochaetaceae bacterium]
MPKSSESLKKAREKFFKLAAMPYEKFQDLLKKETKDGLENLLCTVFRRSFENQDEKFLFKCILGERWARIRDTWQWTPERKKQVLDISVLFSAAWKKGFVEAKDIIDTLYEHAKDKTEFLEDFYAEIILEPMIIARDPGTGEEIYDADSIENVLMENQRLEICLSKNDYNPETKDESGFRENTNIKRDLNWNIEPPFEGFEDDDGYICYALHELACHYEWTMQDIIKITGINIMINFTRIHTIP